MTKLEKLIKLVYLGKENTVLNGEEVKHGEAVEIPYKQAEELTLRYNKVWVYEEDAEKVKKGMQEEFARFKKFQEKRNKSVKREVKKTEEEKALEERKKVRDARRKVEAPKVYEAAQAHLKGSGPEQKKEKKSEKKVEEPKKESSKK